MKRPVSMFLFLCAMGTLLLSGEGRLWAENTVQIPCGEYELITRHRDNVEKLYRINTKTGVTWVLEDKDIGWVKLREQQQ